MTDTEREQLTDLIQSPGWLRLKAWAEAEYGPALLARVAAEPDEMKALQALRASHAITGAIQVVLSWPERQLAKAAQQEPVAVGPSRRGGL